MQDIGRADKIQEQKMVKTILNVEKLPKLDDTVDAVAIATAGAVNNSNSAVIGSTGNLVQGYNTIDFQSLSNKNVFLENDAVLSVL